MARNPRWAQRPERDFESGGCVVDQRSSLNGTNALPFGHDSAERPFAVVPRPNVFHWRIVRCGVDVGGHERTSLMNGVEGGAGAENGGRFPWCVVFFHVPFGFVLAGG